MRAQAHTHTPGASAFAGNSLTGAPSSTAKGNLKGIRKLGEANRGKLVGETHFVVAGGQVKSMLPWLGHMKHGEPQARRFGMSMPLPNLKPDFEDQARAFVDEILDQPLAASAESRL